MHVTALLLSNWEGFVLFLKHPITLVEHWITSTKVRDGEEKKKTHLISKENWMVLRHLCWALFQMPSEERVGNALAYPKWVVLLRQGNSLHIEKLTSDRVVGSRPSFYTKCNPSNLPINFSGLQFHQLQDPRTGWYNSEEPFLLSHVDYFSVASNLIQTIVLRF